MTNALIETLTDTRWLGDALDLLNRIPRESIKTAFFDPQYRGVLDALDYGNEGERQQGRALLPQMGPDDIMWLLRNISDTLAPSGHLFLWLDKFHLCEGFTEWFQKSPDLNVVDLITWNKERIGMGYRSRRTSEYLLVVQKTPKRAKGVWTIKNIPDVWNEKVTREKAYPHRKPIGLIARLIEATTQENDIVLDPAAGSFTTMIAAHNTGRKFIGGDISTGETPLPDALI
jgi:site-specific DNA-methyltransferase (adenine-specific)